MRVSSPRPGPRRAAWRRARLTLAAFLLVATTAAAPAAAGWWDDAAEARESSLTEIRRAPDRWRDVPVLLRVRFGGTGERVNPFFTQFTPERWQPVKLLPAGGAADAGRELATAFVVRGGREDLRLSRISPNLPVLARAVVRDTVAGEPWVEVLSFTLDGDPLTPEESARVGEGDRFLDHRNPEAAERLYRQVLAGRKLDARDHASLLRKIGVALHDQRRPADALAAFREALAVDPDDQDARHRARHLEESLARTPLPATDGATPPIAGRAAASTPARAGGGDVPLRPDEPLLLPGRHRALAPPSGLPSGATGAVQDTPSGPASGAASGPASQTPRAGAPPPRPPSGSARPRPDETPVSRTPPAPVDEPVEAEPEEDAPPPVPKPPRLSGPK